MQKSCKNRFHQRILERILKSGVILQVQKSFAIYLKESDDLLNRHFLQNKLTNQKFLARIFQDLRFFAFLQDFCNFQQEECIILHYLAWSCKKLPRILQVFPDRLTREIGWSFFSDRCWRNLSKVFLNSPNFWSAGAFIVYIMSSGIIKLPNI